MKFSPVWPSSGSAFRSRRRIAPPVSVWKWVREGVRGFREGESARRTLSAWLALLLTAGPAGWAQEAQPVDRTAGNTRVRLGGMAADSPVKFPESGPLPAQFPPDVAAATFDPGEPEFYLFASPERSLAQVKAIQAVMPAGRFTVPLNDWQNLSRTRRIIEMGGQLHVMAIGDSIVNDTMRSGWVSLFREAYPQASITATVYVRGGGGCQHFQEADRIARVVVPRRPDLVFLGGISQRDLVSIATVIDQLRAGLPEVEILLGTGAFGTTDPRDAVALAQAPHSGTGAYGAKLKQLATVKQCAYLDFTTPWAEYLRSAGVHPHRFYRDAVHANEFGEQVLAKILLGFWQPKDRATTSPRFPLSLSVNRRHLVEPNGTPFLYQADTPWMLFTKLTEAEAKEYLARRKEQGFTALQVMLTGFLGMTNLAGELPFAGKPPEQDFAQPNEKFFAHVDRVVAEAQRQGMLLAIAPAWSGCCGEGWAGQEQDGRLKPLKANGEEKSREFGRWLGRRYGKFDHVLWILGGDNDPDNARAEIRALGLGLKETAPQQLITYHAASTHSSTDVWPADERWLDVSMVYSYFRGFNKAWNKTQPDIYEVSHAEFAKIPVRPFFLGESTYEGEHDAWGSALQARKQAYWCVLGGGFGHAYGSPNWNFPKNWRDVLEFPGANSLKHLRVLLESRPWWTLLPDVNNVVAVDGRGAFATNDYAVTALAHDGSFALSYLPTKRSLTIDLTKVIGERVIASWFNPRTGETTRLGEFTDKRRQAFEPPGEGDWVLVLEAAATKR